MPISIQTTSTTLETSFSISKTSSIDLLTTTSHIKKGEMPILIQTTSTTLETPVSISKTTSIDHSTTTSHILTEKCQYRSKQLQQL